MIAVLHSVSIPHACECKHIAAQPVWSPSFWTHFCPQALLVTRLDGKLEGQYAAIFVPLHIVVLALLVTAVVGSPDNPCALHQHVGTLI